MMVMIEPQYTGEITRAEAIETTNKLRNGQHGYQLPTMQGALQGYDWLIQATAEQVQVLLDWYAPILVRELKALDDANRFRPDYAPKGRPTKSQMDAQLSAQQTVRMVRALTYLHAQKAAK